jgi:hypothetical protein
VVTVSAVPVVGPRLSIAQLPSARLVSGVDGTPGLVHRLEYATGLQVGPWKPLAVVTNDVLGRFNLWDVPPANEPMRVYRSVHP